MCYASQGANDISIDFTKVNSLWDELGDLNEVPPCSSASAKKMLKRE